MTRAEQTKIAQVQHRQGITRYWEMFGAERILQKGEWGVEFWPTQEELLFFEQTIREKYDATFTAAPRSLDEIAYEGQVKSVRLGVGLPWDQTPFRLFGQAPEERIYGEELAGVKDEANREFTFARPFKPGSVCLYLDGMRLLPGEGNDYIEVAPNAVRLVEGVAADSVLLADYTGFTAAL